MLFDASYFYDPFHNFRQPYQLVRAWDADRCHEELEGWSQVNAFMARIILVRAMWDNPERFKSYVIRSGDVWSMDHRSAPEAWTDYITNHLMPDWMPTHVLFQRDPADFEVTVPVVASVVTHAPEPTEWIEIAFVDPDNNPVPNVGWTVELADGRVMHGVTGRNGLFRTNSGPPGNARLTYRPNGLLASA